jgi:hypothetical protein
MPENRRKTGKRIAGGEATRFKKGSSGNPGGRPKKKPLTEALEQIYSNPKEAQEAALAMAKKVKKGDVRAFSEVANRLEGKVAQQVGLDVTVAMTPGEMQKASAILDRMRVIDAESLTNDSLDRDRER